MKSQEKIEKYGVFIKCTDYVDDIQKGRLYCNSMSYFRKLNECDGIGDQNEGRILFRPKELNLLGLKCFEEDLLSDVEVSLDVENIFLFCLTLLPPCAVTKDGRHMFKLKNEQSKKFEMLGASSFVTIYPVDRFIKKVMNRAKNLGIKCIHGKVQYGNRDEFCKTHHLTDVVEPGKIDSLLLAFHKDEKYWWQNEYRFLFYGIKNQYIKDNPKHYVLNIYSIRDLVYISKDAFRLREKDAL